MIFWEREQSGADSTADRAAGSSTDSTRSQTAIQERFDRTARCGQWLSGGASTCRAPGAGSPTDRREIRPRGSRSKVLVAGAAWIRTAPSAGGVDLRQPDRAAPRDQGRASAQDRRGAAVLVRRICDLALDLERV